MQPLSISSVSAQPQRFVAYQKNRPVISHHPQNTAPRFGKRNFWNDFQWASLISAGITTLGLGATVIFMPPQSLNRASSQQTKLSAPKALSDSPDFEKFHLVYSEFAAITQSETDLKPVLEQLTEKDLKETKRLQDKYEKIFDPAQNSETFFKNANQFYAEWADAVVSPHRGAPKTQELKDKAALYFVQANKKFDTGAELALAGILSLFGVAIGKLMETASRIRKEKAS